MSIILSAAASTVPATMGLSRQVEISLTAVVVVLTLIWPVLAWKARIFRVKAVCGPVRWDESDSLLRFLAIGTMAVAMTIVVASTVVALAVAKLDQSQAALAGNMVAMPFAFLTVVVATAGMRKDGLRILGLDLGKLRIGLLGGVIGLVLVLPWLFWALQITEAIIRHWHIKVPTEHPIFELWRQTASGSPLRVLAVISAVVSAPLAEEALFRGLLQTGLVRLFSPGAITAELARQPVSVPQPTMLSRWLGIIVTAGLFTLVHPVYSQPAIFILALGLGYVYERTGSLWACIFMHMLFNGQQFAMFIIAQPH